MHDPSSVYTALVSDQLSQFSLSYQHSEEVVRNSCEASHPLIPKHSCNESFKTTLHDALDYISGIKETTATSY